LKIDGKGLFQANLKCNKYYLGYIIYIGGVLIALLQDKAYSVQ